MSKKYVKVKCKMHPVVKNQDDDAKRGLSYNN